MAASTPELIQLLNALQSKAKKWYNIGLQLNLSTDELDIIEADGQGVEDRLRNMLKKCLNKTDPPLTWNTLIRALKEPAVDEPVLANELERKFVLNSATTSTRGNSMLQGENSKEFQIIRENADKIKGSFAVLLDDVLDKLRELNLDVNKFRAFVVALFHSDSIPKTSDVVEVFESVTRNGLWDYWHVTQLEKIVQQYGGEDPEMSSLVSNYKKELSGYRATTKIVDYIKLCSTKRVADPDQPLVPNPAKYDSDFYTQLTVKLDTRVTDKTLEYVDELWRSLAEYFLLPDLSALLESIQEGCISITWLVPAHFAFQISENIQDAEEFFKQMSIIQLKLDEVYVYSCDSGDTQQMLQNACIEGNSDKLAELIADGVNTNALFENGWTPLMIASSKGHAKVVELLLKHGADVDAKKMSGWTSLLTASKRGHTEVVELLLKRGANTEAKLKSGVTALNIACEHGHEAIAELLLLYKADVNAQDFDGLTPLMAASSKGQPNVVELLLKHGAEIEAKHEDGSNALFFACANGHLSVAELLLHYKTDVNFQDNDGWTPLMIAVGKGHLKLVEFLLKHGAEVDAKRKSGSTALIMACELGHKPIAELLLLYNADVNTQKNDGSTPLIQTIDLHNLHVVELLLKHNAAVNIQSENDWTALLFACYKGHRDIVKLLLRHHADMNILFEGSWSPLMLAVKGGHHGIVSLLLDHQADVNVKNELGWTALFIAAENGQLELVKSLLQHNADINIKDKFGATAYDIASASEQRAVCKELENSGYKTETEFTESVRRGVVATSRQISGYFADMENRRIFREVLERTPLEDMPKHSSTTEHENEQEL